MHIRFAFTLQEDTRLIRKHRCLLFFVAAPQSDVFVADVGAAIGPVDLSLLAQLILTEAKQHEEETYRGAKVHADWGKILELIPVCYPHHELRILAVLFNIDDSKEHSEEASRKQCPKQ